MYSRNIGDSSGRRSRKWSFSKLHNTILCSNSVAAKGEETENDDLDNRFVHKKKRPSFSQSTKINTTSSSSIINSEAKNEGCTCKAYFRKELEIQ